MNEIPVSNPPMPAYLEKLFNTIKGRRPNTVETPLTVGGMNEIPVSNPPMPVFIKDMFNIIKKNPPNGIEAPLPTDNIKLIATGGKRRKNTRKHTRKIYRGGQVVTTPLPRPTISFLRSFIDPNAVNKVFNNTAIISITYPTQIVDSLYKLEARLLAPNGTNIANIKIKNINNIRELTVSELQVSIRYQLTVKLVNKTTNNKSVDSNTLTIVIAPPPAPRPAPIPAPRPSPRPAPRPAPASQPPPNIITTVLGATNESLGFPSDVKFDLHGNMYVSDTRNKRIIKITTANQKTSYSLNGHPIMISLDKEGNIFGTTFNNNMAFKIHARNGAVTRAAGSSYDPEEWSNRSYSGPANRVKLNYPYATAVDPSGNIIIADTGNGCIRRVNPNTGNIDSIVGHRSYGPHTGMTGNAIYAGLGFPSGLVYDASGNLFICDMGISLVVKVNANTGIVQIVAGSRSDGISGGEGFAGDGGPAHRASLKFPFGVAIDKSGNLFIADTYNNRIRRVDLRTGIITTVVGSGETGSGFGGFSGDGGPATSATLNLPRGVAFDAAGNMFIADSGNNRIRRVNGPFL